MSNIDYNIWGDPDTIWFHRQTAPNVTSNCVLSEIRAGASSWDDPDFEDYPATKFCRDICLFGYWRDGYINPDGETPLDNTLSYVAIDNPDLPQMDLRVATPGTQAGWANNALIQSDPDEPLPFSLATYRDYGQVYNPFYNSVVYGIDGINNDASIYAAQGFQRWCPFGRYDKGADIGNTRWGEYNPNGRLGMIGLFGTKSIFLEIIVRRYDGGYYDTVTQTLKSYASQSLEWRLEHPIFSCYGKPYYRTNKNGTYTNGAPIGYTLDNQMIALSPVFYRSLHSNGTHREYTTYLMGGHGQMSEGYFPIYGAVLSNSGYTSQWVSCSHPYDDPTQTQMNSGVYFYGCQRGELIKRSPDSAQFQLSLEGTDENIEWLIRGAAAYGMFFCLEIGTLGNPGRDSGDTERWIDPEMYCGTISDRGYTNGDYTQGEGNKHQKQYIMKSSTETPYDPDIPPQPKNNYDHQTVFNHIGELAALTKRYVMSGDMVEILGQMLYDVGYTISSGDTDFSEYDSKILDTFLTNNPIDAIISLRRYPMSIPHSEDLSNVLLGKYDTMLSTYTTSAAALTYLFQLRDPILPRFGDSFLDYEPYTHFELYVPFCGTVALEPADILNRSLSVQLLVDFTTGTCTAFIMSDLLCIKTVEGNIAIDIPVTGIQSVTAASQLNNAIVSRRQAQVNTVTAGLSLISPGGIGNPFKAVGNLINAGEQLNKAEYDLQHQNVPPHVIGAASPVAGWAIDLQCRLIIYYPDGDIIRKENGIPVWNVSELAKYGKTAGFATVEAVNQLSEYAPGLIVATDVDLSGIACTEEERELIAAALSEGCYFPALT